ncbi:alpha/beta hydrolase [Actomonas aquatica]|uniref:Alpha/beta hydrolase-fold protein n=1 Tax=Actomonas aquatica TaxID=2866162 RepID=A0ABZ1CCX0_9BACT|nr:alpha/beta hydrolase-fold protein [Opitutus sp. WL0086]WRQ89517.1 alpha/beta hydrolase-fold protein [Opitutus sp. WL0086]
MIKFRSLLWVALAALAAPLVSVAHDPAAVMTGDFELTPDSLVQDGVPQGELKGPFEFRSGIITGTVRQYWVFVPAQYDPATPASVLVFQDGHRATHPEGSLRVQNVLTNLIHEGAIPPTIGIFITPGDTRAEFPQDLGWGNPNHRWQEYDVLTADYGRFIIEEMLPLVGQDYNLTDDPEQRAIGGTSSGAICAFTVAWNNPDVFRKVISFIGSYVSIGSRPPEDDPTGAWSPGGQDYPAMIRRLPPKPIKIFFQDGSNDLDNPWGNWFLANQQMVAAINFANQQAERVENGDTPWDPYRNAPTAHVAGVRWQEKHVWTDGEHSDKHGGHLLPDAIRWLWADTD